LDIEQCFILEGIRRIESEGVHFIFCPIVFADILDPAPAVVAGKCGHDTQSKSQCEVAIL